MHENSQFWLKLCQNTDFSPIANFKRQNEGFATTKDFLCLTHCRNETKDEWHVKTDLSCSCCFFQTVLGDFQTALVKKRGCRNQSHDVCSNVLFMDTTHVTTWKLKELECMEIIHLLYFHIFFILRIKCYSQKKLMVNNLYCTKRLYKIPFVFQTNTSFFRLFFLLRDAGIFYINTEEIT